MYLCGHVHLSRLELFLRGRGEGGRGAPCSLTGQGIGFRVSYTPLRTLMKMLFMGFTAQALGLIV